MAGHGLHTTPKTAFGSIRVACARSITVLLACVVLLTTTSSDRLRAHISLVPSFYSTALCVAIAILLLPAQWAALGLPLAAGVMYGLAWLSELKTIALGMPLTALDVEILFTDPSIVANALGFAASVDLTRGCSPRRRYFLCTSLEFPHAPSSDAELQFQESIHDDFPHDSKGRMADVL
jgi:hypothetical protein